MKGLSSILTLTLLTVALTSAVPRNDEVMKRDGITTPSGVVVRTLPSVDMEGDDQAPMNEGSNNMDLMEIMNQCNETFVIQMSYMQALNDSGSFPDETERNPKCYIRCVLEKAEVASAEGVFNPTRAAMVFTGDSGGTPMDDVVVMAADCGNKRAESCKCERSYQYVKCLMEMEIQRYEKSGQKAQRRISIL